MSAAGSETLPPRATRLAAVLEEWSRPTVTLTELWTLWATADPVSATRPTRRADLAAALDALAAIGVVTPSRARDTTAAPPLPKRLTLPAPTASPTAAALAREVPWRPELAWAASARLTVGQVGLLREVNGWLRDRGRDTDVVPLRERSLEVFGHEKRLDRMLHTAVFGPGRLSLNLLRTFRSRPPLPARRLGDGPTLLVVENSDTFDTFARVLSADPGDVGYLAWGAGAAFEASVVSVAELPDVTSIAYFGDLDADGLRIPDAAAALAAAEALPAVRPATGLYRLLLDVGVPQPGQPMVTADRAAELAAWLALEERPRATELLCGGARLPQEAVTARLLATDTSWRDGLLSGRLVN
ncbi:DUF2220 domain-containing protein [Frankia sp. Mgl5]|uniref:Wadjet anti-phage system protein JetD domain-containing protein n=1 Tax=Frankia sp. Mgl5 TaxID=2933793 RepID=UPI00200FFBAF|nr:Wadjet anti-phage system protein JetD domain-containing protein [Frankia sp. Mgl5]MCK9925847.1 DUF2220 domain-containing protein [Frankia sp. Mgl5]